MENTAEENKHMVGERRGVKRAILKFEKEYFTQVYNYRTPERDRVFQYHLHTILAKVPKVNKLLDVGCGLGYFLAKCKAHDIATSGIDISSYAVQKAKDRTKSDAVYRLDASSERWPYNAGMFDVVTAFDVVEHVRDARFLLQEAYRVVKPGGLVYVTTQNNQGNFGRLVEQFFPDDPTHINKKNAGAWRDEFKKIGFRNIIIKGIIFYGFPPITALRIKLEKLKIPVIIQPIFSPITYFAGVLVITARK